MRGRFSADLHRSWMVTCYSGGFLDTNDRVCLVSAQRRVEASDKSVSQLRTDQWGTWTLVYKYMSLLTIPKDCVALIN